MIQVDHDHGHAVVGRLERIAQVLLDPSPVPHLGQGVGEGQRVERSAVAVVDPGLVGHDAVDGQLSFDQPGDERLVQNVTVRFNENADAQEEGAHVATIPLKVINQLISHPLTDIGNAKFIEDFKKIPM